MPELNRVEVWLNKALELEYRGRDYYEKAAGKAKDSLVADFFKNMAEQETVHAGIIKKIYDKAGQGDACWLAAGAEEPGGQTLNRMFLDLSKHSPKAGEDILQAIEDGLKFETEAMDFYKKAIPEASCQAEKNFLTRLAGEENEHRQMLADMKLYYTDPEAWAEKMDNMHLDGV